MVNNFSAMELVTSCYRAFLKREPENQRVVDDRVEAYASIDEVVSSFIKSDEFRNNYSGESIHDYLLSNQLENSNKIEADVAPDLLMEMFERIQAGWRRLGETEPYWSVITSDKFKMANFDENLEDFLASGRASVQWFRNVARRNGIELPKNKKCFELGCGVGRITLPLSEMFETVSGADVSKGNLRECSALIERSGKTNINTILLDDIQDLQTLSNFDVFYSILVLQHNPPPVQKFALKTILKKANPGGIAYFQIPTHIPNYSFTAEEYLKDTDDDMEMHALPMQEVFKLLSENGFSVLEVFQDHFTGMPGSHTFFAQKNATS